MILTTVEPLSLHSFFSTKQFGISLVFYVLLARALSCVSQNWPLSKNDINQMALTYLFFSSENVMEVEKELLKL